MVETVQVDDEGHFLEDGDCALPGLSCTGSRVQMTFSEPSGTMTGKLLPSGRPTDIILSQTTIETRPTPVEVSLVDAANPFCFVNGTTLPDAFHAQGPGGRESFIVIENIRREAAVLMGLAKTVEEAALTRGTPKIAILSQPKGLADGSPLPDVQVIAYSMGKIHGSLQLTGAVCLATAACTEGTVANQIRNQVRSETRKGSQITRVDSASALGLNRVNLGHPGGNMDVDVVLNGDNQADEVTVFRTARRLFGGTVYYLQ
jgi:2-methylaconitate cis-trans-isomerase PrpF